jgi:hypothetical protein
MLKGHVMQLVELRRKAEDPQPHLSRRLFVRFNGYWASQKVSESRSM